MMFSCRIQGGPGGFTMFMRVNGTTVDHRNRDSLEDGGISFTNLVINTGSHVGVRTGTVSASTARYNNTEIQCIASDSSGHVTSNILIILVAGTANCCYFRKKSWLATQSQ